MTLANMARDVLENEDINKLNQIKKTYNTELSEKDLSASEKEKRYKNRTKNLESDDISKLVKVNDDGLTLYRKTLYKYYQISRDLRLNKKTKIYRVKKKTNTNSQTENAQNSPQLQSASTHFNNKFIILPICGLMIFYLIYKKRFFKY
jgi:hypothetical protein